MSQVSRRALRWAAPVVAAAVAAAVVLQFSQSAEVPRSRRLDGASVEVLGAWSGLEQQRFTAVLRRFSKTTGVSVHYTSAGLAGVPVVLGRRFGHGDPPDVALLPQPGLLRSLAAEHVLRRPSRRVAAAVERHYSARWRRLGSYDGRVYGVWFKAAHKSLVWYDVAAFERAGLVPPADLAGLGAAATRLSRPGRPAFAVSARDGWTLTDWFEDLYLHLAGPRAYDELAAHRRPWTDPTVVTTLRAMAALLAPTQVFGGIGGARRIGFERSVSLAFGPAHAAAMLHEGDFVAGALSSGTQAVLGVDVDVFPFPGADPAGRAVVAGGDVAVLLRSSPAADQLLSYLATPAAARTWAALGGFISPNLDLDLAVYPDAVTRSVARSLLDAGADLRFDLSDLQPASFGGRDDAGLPAELRDFLATRDPVGTAARLELEAAAAYPGDGSARAATVSGGR